MAKPNTQFSKDWNPAFEGTLQGIEAGIYLNTNKDVVVVILDKKDNVIEGAVLQYYTVLTSDANTDQLLDSYSGKAISFAYREESNTQQFVLASAEPQYVAWNQSAIDSTVQALAQEVAGKVKALQTLASSLQMELISLKMASQEIQSAFLNQPLSLAVIGYSGKPTTVQTVTPKPTQPEKPTALVIGKSRANELVEESMNLFKKTVVSAGTPENRHHVLQVLIENALLSNAAVTIFDWGEKFNGLNSPNPDPKELHAFGIDFEPIGFPAKHFHAKTDFVVDVNLLHPKGFAELLGVVNEHIITFVETVMKKQQYENLEALIAAMEKEKGSPTLNQYNINKAVRIIRLALLRFPGLFGGANPIKEISKEWVRAIGRAGVLHFKEIKDEKAMLLLCHNLVRGLQEYYASIETPSKSFIVIPQITRLIGNQHRSLLSKDLARILIDLETHGIGLIIEAQNEKEIQSSVLKDMIAKVTIISGNDVGIQLSHKAQYRATMRPLLAK